MFLAFPQGPGGFRKLREAYRKLFHRSWYLQVPVVTSYSQKPWGGIFFTVHGISQTYAPNTCNYIPSVSALFLYACV